MKSLLIALIWAVVPSEQLKVLSYNAHFAHSHVNFNGKISETMAEAGHEVIMLAPIIDYRVKNFTSDKIKEIIRIAPNDYVKDWKGVDAGFSKINMWTGGISVGAMIKPVEEIHAALASMCSTTLQTSGLLERLRAEKFDIAFAESFDLCAFVLFQQLGIKKYALIFSVTTMDYNFEVTGVPDQLSYVPSLVSPAMDDMIFAERLRNVIANQVYRYCVDFQMAKFKPVIKKLYPDFPLSKDIIAQSSYLFLNYEPLIDFPKLTMPKIVPVGGIQVKEGQPLDEYWTSIMSRRPHNVLISFGSIVRSSQMPESYKKSIRDTVRKFPNVTFIWKYEEESHRIADGLDNLVDVRWMPQTDLFRDGRLSLFVSHCGAGSTMEAMMAGIPMLAVPLISDGPRNANIAKRMGTTIVIGKDDIGKQELLEDSIRRLLFSDTYRDKAKRVAKMLEGQPMSAKQRLVKYMEFMGEFGPMQHLDPHSRKQGFLQYYLLDILLVALSAVLLLCTVAFFVIRTVYRLLRSQIHKIKKE